MITASSRETLDLETNYALGGNLSVDRDVPPCIAVITGLRALSSQTRSREGLKAFRTGSLESLGRYSFRPRLCLSSALLRRQRIEFGDFLVSEFRQTTELAKASLADAADEICALAVTDVPDIALQKRLMY